MTVFSVEYLILFVRMFMYMIVSMSVTVLDLPASDYRLLFGDHLFHQRPDHRNPKSCLKFIDFVLITFKIASVSRTAYKSADISVIASESMIDHMILCEVRYRSVSVNQVSFIVQGAIAYWCAYS